MSMRWVKVDIRFLTCWRIRWVQGDHDDWVNTWVVADDECLMTSHGFFRQSRATHSAPHTDGFSAGLAQALSPCAGSTTFCFMSSDAHLHGKHLLNPAVYQAPHMTNRCGCHGHRMELPVAAMTVSTLFTPTPLDHHALTPLQIPPWNAKLSLVLFVIVRPQRVSPLTTSANPGNATDTTGCYIELCSPT